MFLVYCRVKGCITQLSIVLVHVYSCVHAYVYVGGKQVQWRLMLTLAHLCHTYYKFQTLVIVGENAKNDSAGMYNNCIHHIAQRVKCRQNQSHGRPLVVSSLA